MEILRKHKIGIICGGWSSERAISLKSGYYVYEALMQSEYNCELIDLDNERTAFSKETYNNIDIAFILVHGRGGEDGRLQNFFEKINLNFTGSDSKSSYIGMDKIQTKKIWKKEGINYPEFIEFNDNFEEILKLNQKVVVKPANEGSSFGISIIENNKAALKNAINEAKKYDEKVLIENFINGSELTVAILDEKAFNPIEIIPNSDYYDFNAKYMSNQTIYREAKLSKEQKSFLQNQALHSFKTIGCSGWGRVDLIFNGEDFYFLEVNTVPGMTETSLVPKAASFSGLAFTNLLEKILLKSIA
jgi:D-alanine-D-alanine ligase